MQAENDDKSCSSNKFDSRQRPTLQGSASCKVSIVLSLVAKYTRSVFVLI